MLLSLQYIYRYQIATHVPLDRTTTFEELSKATGLGQKDLSRFLRVAISRHVFCEPTKGTIAHTAASKLLINNPMVEAWIQNIAQEFWPAFTRTVEATERWPGSEEPNETVSITPSFHPANIRTESYTFYRVTPSPTAPPPTHSTKSVKTNVVTNNSSPPCDSPTSTQPTISPIS